MTELMIIDQNNNTELATQGQQADDILRIIGVDSKPQYVQDRYITKIKKGIGLGANLGLYTNILTTIVTDQNTKDRTKSQYTSAMMLALSNGVNFFDVESSVAYFEGLNSGERAFLRPAVSLWVEGVKTQLLNNDTPETALHTQAQMNRFEGLARSMKAKRNDTKKGTVFHTWLTKNDVRQLLNLPDRETQSGRRDYIVLALLVGSALRREELSNLTFDNLIIQDGITILQVVGGKGNKDRAFRVNSKMAKTLADWRVEIGEGNIVRGIDRHGKMNGSLSGQGIFGIVRKYGKAMEHPTLAPHDLRRTWAKLAHSGGLSIDQISQILGHSDIKTTQLYLGLEIDLSGEASDFIPF